MESESHEWDGDVFEAFDILSALPAKQREEFIARYFSTIANEKPVEVLRDIVSYLKLSMADPESNPTAIVAINILEGAIAIKELCPFDEDPS